ncbi:MAG: hypothetical protein WKG06_13315 [Segetibacter sp.]
MIAYDFTPEALEILKKKKNKILLQLHGAIEAKEPFKICRKWSFEAGQGHWKFFRME